MDRALLYPLLGDSQDSQPFQDFRSTSHTQSKIMGSQLETQSKLNVAIRGELLTNLLAGPGSAR